MHIARNMGEWNKIYVLLKLLVEGKFFAGDQNLNKVENLLYNILKINLRGNPMSIEYVLSRESCMVNLVDTNTGETTNTFNSAEFVKHTNAMFSVLKEHKESMEGFITIPAIEVFLEKIKCNHLKSPSKTGDDISIVLQDSITRMPHQLSFSIKSSLGAPATLLNADNFTRFRYRLEKPLPEYEIKRINGLSSERSIHDRFNEIRKSTEIVFEKVCEQVFHDNLTMIDTRMPELLGQYLIVKYSHEENSLKKLTESISKQNPIEFNSKSSSPFYEFKLKQFLGALAFGMVPQTPWLGKYNAGRGFLVIKENGDILSYCVNNQDLLEKYLYERTFFEESLSNRHDFGILKSDSKGLYIELALGLSYI